MIDMVESTPTQTHNLTLSFLTSLQQELHTDVTRLKDELNSLKSQRNVETKENEDCNGVSRELISFDQKTNNGEDAVSKFNQLKNIKTTISVVPTVPIVDLVENSNTPKSNGSHNNAKADHNNNNNNNSNGHGSNNHNSPNTPKTSDSEKHSITEDERNDIIAALKQILESFSNATTTNNPILMLTSPTTSKEGTPSSVPIEIQTPPTSPEIIRVLPLLNTIKRRTVEILRENEKLKEALANPPPSMPQTWGPGKRIRAERGNRSGSLTSTASATFTSRIPRKLSHSLPFPRSKILSSSTTSLPPPTVTASLASQAASSSSSSSTPVSAPSKAKTNSPRSISPSSSPPSPATTISPRARTRPLSMYNLSPSLVSTTTSTSSTTTSQHTPSKFAKNVPRSLSSSTGSRVGKGKIASIGRSNLSAPSSPPAKSDDELKEWIRQVVGDDASSSTYQQPLQDLLRSGVLLCRLANSLRPGIIRRINTPTPSNPTLTPFRQIENLGFFLEACRTFGMKSRQLFDASDLHAGKNLNGVVNTLYSLAQTFQRMEGTKVPLLVQKGEKEGISEKKVESASKHTDLKNLFNQPIASPVGSPPSSTLQSSITSTINSNSNSNISVTTPPASPNSPALSYTVSSTTTPVTNTLTPTSSAIRSKRSPPTSPNRTNPSSPRKKT